MILYNVTCNIPEEIETEWLNWMKTEHIPEVMNTQLFLSYKIFKLLTEAEGNEGVNYAIQYFAEHIENYEIYAKDFGPTLKAKTYSKYGDKVLAFRTLLKEA
jgi:hypothetical protein